MARAAKNRPSLLACALGAVVAGAWLVAAPRALAQDAAIPAFKTVDSMEARVQGCVTCHGQSGQGTSNDYFPRIAGKPAGYLYNQLVAFRDGTRRYAPMNYLVAYLPDAYLREIAEHYAKQRPPFVPHAAGTARTRRASTGAQALARHGRSEARHPGLRRVPRRGPHRHGAGHPRPRRPAPELHRRRSSTRWRTGERAAAEPDCMKRIATRLIGRRHHCGRRLAGAQEPPRDASPESSNLVRMPLACGSQR